MGLQLAQALKECAEPFCIQGMRERLPVPSKSGVLIGLGLGGFVDGIVLHQIMQWHNMGSAVLPPMTMEAMRKNMVWDGQFHAATWLFTFIGVLWLWRDGYRQQPMPPLTAFLGQMLLGWGLFNLVEGVIDHHLLEIHHVKDIPSHVPMHDWVFLAVGGVLFILLGWGMARSGREAVR